VSTDHEVGNPRSILVVAGEVSGDMHAAKLIRALQAKDPSLQFWGIGGEELRACGMDILYDVREMAVLGLTEVLKRYGFFKRVLKEISQRAAAQKPDAVLLVDYPGFNLRLAKKVHQMGLKTIYYVCPQVWAWHQSRKYHMAEVLDLLLVIFPFEVNLFKDTDLHVEFVGHPLVDKAKQVLAAPEESLPWKGTKKLALLPGSRKQEVRRILAPMWEAACILEEKDQSLSTIIAAPTEEIAQVARELINDLPVGPRRIEIVVGKTRQILRQAHGAMVASGTATIEAALMGCPMIVVYITAGLTYFLGKRLVQIKHIGMVNIVAGTELCPEFIQHAAQPAAMAEAVGIFLDDEAARYHIQARLKEVSTLLGHPQGADKAASLILAELGPVQA